jgi:sporulation protein YqfC
MAKGERLKAKVADILDLPRDLLADLFRLTLAGRGQLFIENHKGIILYQPDLIRLSVRGGEVIVRGRDLQVRFVYTAEMYIEGRIDTIEVEGLD